MELSVDLQIEINSKKVTGLEPMREKLSRQIQSAALLPEEDREKLLRRLAELPQESRLCHGDYHIYNLLQARDRTVVIDWVDSSAGNPCADAYRSYLLYAQSLPGLAERYLQLYCQKSGVSREAVLDWAPVVAGARLSEGVSEESAGRLLQIVRQA